MISWISPPEIVFGGEGEHVEQGEEQEKMMCLEFVTYTQDSLLQRRRFTREINGNKFRYEHSQANQHDLFRT